MYSKVGNAKKRKASMRVRRPTLEEESVIENPFFNYHAILRIGNDFHDPSYGISGFPEISTIAPWASLRDGYYNDCFNEIIISVEHDENTFSAQESDEF